MDEQQSSCTRCEMEREEARFKYERLLMDAQEFLSKRLLEIYLEHERGDHAQDTD